MKNSDDKVTINYGDSNDSYDLYINGLNAVSSGTLYLSGDAGMLPIDDPILVNGVDSGKTGMQHDFDMISEYCIRVNQFRPLESGEMDFIFVSDGKLYQLSEMYDYGYHKILMTVPPFLLTLLNGVQTNQWSLPYDNPTSVLYTNDGTKLALFDSISEVLVEYDLDIESSPPSMSLSGYTYGFGTLVATYAKMRYDGKAIVAILSGGTYGYYLAKFVLETANDFGSIKFDSLVNLTWDQNPQAAGMSNDGHRAWVIDTVGNDTFIRVYMLTTQHSLYRAELISSINLSSIGQSGKTFTDCLSDPSEKYLFLVESSGDYVQLKLNTQGDISDGVVFDGIPVRDVEYELANDHLTFIKNGTVALVDAWINHTVAVYDTNIPETILPEINDSDDKIFWPHQIYSRDISVYTDAPSAMALNYDEEVIWIYDSTNNQIVEYDVYDLRPTGTTLDMSSITEYVEKLMVIGDQLYVGLGNGNINQYQLESSWNLSSATLVHQIDTSSEVGYLASFMFNSDASKLWVMDNNTLSRLVEYGLSIPGDLSTATRTQTPAVVLTDFPEDSANDMYLSADGSSVYMINYSDFIVYKYDMVDDDITQLEYANESWHNLDPMFSSSSGIKMAFAYYQGTMEIRMFLLSYGGILKKYTLVGIET